MKALVLTAALLLAPTLAHAQDCSYQADIAGMVYELRSLGQPEEAVLGRYFQFESSLPPADSFYGKMVVGLVYRPDMPEYSLQNRADFEVGILNHCRGWSTEQP